MRVTILTALAVVWATLAGAQNSGFRKLSSLEDGRNWEGVGRLEIAGDAFCTGALISETLVLTAAHCLYDPTTGSRVPAAEMQFLAGWRNGRAAAYRYVRNAVHHPDYQYTSASNAERVRNDVALLELQHPIRNPSIQPFDTALRPDEGETLGVVSYGHDRSDAPSLQELCRVIARQDGVLVMSCEVDFGSSGSPVFSTVKGTPHIVSVVSAKAEYHGRPVSLGTSLQEPLATLRAMLDKESRAHRLVAGHRSSAEGGPKFVRP